MSTRFPDASSDKKALEEGAAFSPRFDADGLVTAVVTDAADGTLLMVAHMNAEALALTLETGIAHYWSRSRSALWKKGETSGNFQHVVEIRTDCDQDAVWLRVKVVGPRRNLPHRPAFMLLPDGRAGGRRERRLTTMAASRCSMPQTPIGSRREPLHAFADRHMIHHFDTAGLYSCRRDKGDRDARVGVIARQTRRAGGQRPLVVRRRVRSQRPRRKPAFRWRLAAAARAAGRISACCARSTRPASRSHDRRHLDRRAGRRLLSRRQARRAGRIRPQPDQAAHLRPARFPLRRQRPVRRHAARRARCSEHMARHHASRTCPSPSSASRPKSAPATRSGCRAAR